MKNTTKVVKLPSISLPNVLLLIEQTSKKRKVLEGMLKALQEKEDKLHLIKDKLLVREHNKVVNETTLSQFETKIEFPLLPAIITGVEFDKVYELSIFQQRQLKVVNQAGFIKFVDAGDNEHVFAVFAKKLSHGKITPRCEVISKKWDSNTFELKLRVANENHLAFKERAQNRTPSDGKKGLKELLDLADF
jgi:hypothetical protein